MKISKKEIENIMRLGKEWRDYVDNQYRNNYLYRHIEDSVANEKWEAYYNPTRKHANILYSLIDYALNENLDIDNVTNALNAMGIGVYDD